MWWLVECVWCDVCDGEICEVVDLIVSFIVVCVVLGVFC